MLDLLPNFAAVALLAAAPATGGNKVEPAVVRIVNYAQRANWYAPWDMRPVDFSSGTGFVIRGGRILTNAHVVSDSRSLTVFLYGDPVPHEARVVVAGHDCDLALVEPVEAGLLAPIVPLDFGGLPVLRSQVETYGYPAGGDEMSSTRGVVSRIEMQRYVHSGIDSHLALQTDASINPGNSGGPVVQEGKVVGVAFQASEQLENTGYVIPVEVVRHFLDDFKDGRYDGYPDLAVSHANLENPAARAFAGLARGETGVRVERLTPGGSAEGHLRVGDVLLAAEGKPIANDGSVAEGGLRLNYGLLLDRLQVGEVAKLRVLRGKERLDLAVPLKPEPMTPRYTNQYDRLPRYYVYAGLLFQPLDAELMKNFGEDWSRTGDHRLVYEHVVRIQEDPEAVRGERVVLVRRLNHPINSKIAGAASVLIDAVNGKQVHSLEDLVAAIESNQGRFHVFDVAGPLKWIVLDRAQAEAANQEILDRYGIARDRRL